MGSWSSSNCRCLPGLHWMVGSALGLVWVLSLMQGASAQSSNCTVSTFTPLSPCLTYIRPGNTTTPASDCCTPLHSFLSSPASASCICQIVSFANQSGLAFNLTRALEVVMDCYNHTLPSIVTGCKLTSGNAPIGEPSNAPTTSTPSPESGGEQSQINLGSAMLSPSFLLTSSILVAPFLHLGILST